MSSEGVPAPVPSAAGRAARTIVIIVGLLVAGAAAGFVGRLIWPRRRHV